MFSNRTATYVYFRMYFPMFSTIAAETFRLRQYKYPSSTASSLEKEGRSKSTAAIFVTAIAQLRHYGLSLQMESQERRLIHQPSGSPTSISHPSSGVELGRTNQKHTKTQTIIFNTKLFTPVRRRTTSSTSAPLLQLPTALGRFPFFLALLLCRLQPFDEWDHLFAYNVATCGRSLLQSHSPTEPSQDGLLNKHVLPIQ